MRFPAGGRSPRIYKQQPGAQRRNSLTTSIPAPVGGWNARDSIADMDARDALVMDNWFPSTGTVDFRNGWADHVTGIGDQVESLMPYNEADGSQTLFAAAGDSFYDVTNPGAVGAAVVSSLASARWESVNFTNSSGDAYLCAFSHTATDEPQYWDGSTWTAITDSTSPGIVNVPTTSLANPWVHKRRMWMVELDSMSAWYLPVDGVGGAAEEFSLSGIFKRGGYLVAGGTWTVDAGEGLDDYCVFISSEGEVALYKGQDPSFVNTWTIQGVWRVGEPIGSRCLLKFGGELLAILKDGVFPLSQAIQSSRVNPRAAITDKIVGAMSEATALYSNNFGWQLEHFPAGDMLILNVPVEEGQNQQQYVMNTNTGSWARFTDIESNCWAVVGETLYFGGDGFVADFWNDQDDNGANIYGDIQPAFSYFGDRGGLKQWKMIRPILSTNGSPTVRASLNVDYETDAPLTVLSFAPLVYGVWDTSLWDQGIWAGGLIQSKSWQSVRGVGTCAALRLTTVAQGITIKFQAADYVYETGGVI